MRTKSSKKGFTIVELVISIAVIGILTAILVPTFIGLTRKANEASDESLVTNLNKALAIHEATPGDTPNATYQDAIEDLKDEGYLANILVTKSDKSLVWCDKDNRFHLEQDGVISARPAEALDINFWAIYDSVPATQRYSIYAGPNWNGNAENLTVGFDAGEREDIPLISYVSDSSQTVTLRTNSATTAMTVNAPNGVVNHYGAVGSLDIVAIAGSSYHEYGKAAFAEIKNGRIALEKGAEVERIHLNATGEGASAHFDGITVAKAAGVEMPTFSRDPVQIPAEGRLVVTLQSGTQTESPKDHVWLTAIGIYEQVTLSDSAESAGTTYAPSASSEEIKGAAAEIANNITFSAEGEEYHVSANKSGEEWSYVVKTESGESAPEYAASVNGSTIQVTEIATSSPVETAQSNGLTEEEKETAKTAAVEEAKSEQEADQYASFIFWEDCTEGAEFYGGTGYENDPYLISSATQLALAARNVNGDVAPAMGCNEYYHAYYKLVTNINISGKAWTPFGASAAKAFAGHIDGNGYSIIGLNNGKFSGEVHVTETTHTVGETYALIAYTKGDVSVKNLTMKDVDIEHVGAKVCAAVIGDTGESPNITTSLTIHNVNVSGSILGKDKVAGLVGYVKHTDKNSSMDVDVRNVKVSGNISISGTGFRAGGLFGFVSVKSGVESVRNAVIDATITKGEATPEKIWLGAITSCYNSSADITFSNIKFTGEVLGHNLKGEVGMKSGKNVNESIYTGYADLVDAHGASLIGTLGQAGEIWWCHTAHDTRVQDPTEVVDSIVGANRDKLYHLVVPTPNAEGAYSFKVEGDSCITNFNNGSNTTLICGPVRVNYSTGAITDNNHVITSGHTAISAEYTYGDMVKEILQNHFISAIDD